MKRTLENCTFIERMVRRGLGEPEQRGGVCMGYGQSECDDEPCETCKKCYLQEYYKDGDAT